MSEENRMVCPDCGVGMNHHADKLVYEDEDEGEGLGGVVEEAHSCPECGKTLTRRVGESEA